MADKKIKEKILTETEAVGGQLKIKVVTYLSAGLGVVVGLAWNSAITALIQYLFPLSQNTILAKFGYALVLTIIITLAIIYLEKILRVSS